MKVLHVISGIGETGGGPSRSSQGLVAALCKEGVDAWIYPFDNVKPWVSGVRKFECSNVLSPQDVRMFDLVHIHGIWSWELHQVVVMCRKAEVPYVIAPRGMLEPWSLKQKWLKKRMARFLYQDRDLENAAALHATAESEADQFRELGFRNKIIVSPNGVNLPKEFLGITRKSWKERRALFVSRMHPKKGVMELVESWARVRPKGWCCEFVYTINGEEERMYEQNVKRRVIELGMVYEEMVDGVPFVKNGLEPVCPIVEGQFSDFIFTGALDDETKWQAYGRSNLFILPTYSENFGIVVAEALWSGVPVITTKGTPWQELEDRKCGWWIDLPPTDSLDVALRKAVAADDLSSKGRLGHKLIEDYYTWPAACAKMIRGYEEVLNART